MIQQKNNIVKKPDKKKSTGLEQYLSKKKRRPLDKYSQVGHQTAPSSVFVHVQS